MHYVYDHLNQFYRFQRLHTFKEEFGPTWEPRYIVFPGYGALPGVWTALARTSSGDRFMLGKLRDKPLALKQITRLVNGRNLAKGS